MNSPSELSDEALVRRAVREERILLTRDRRLADEWRISGIEVLRANDPVGQLVELAARRDLLGRARPFSRCSVCNAPLVPVERAAVRDAVPARVYEGFERFRRCPECGRVYWEGSHVDRMRRVLERALGEAAAGRLRP